jgi:hypothetical protein
MTDEDRVIVPVANLDRQTSDVLRDMQAANVNVAIVNAFDRHLVITMQDIASSRKSFFSRSGPNRDPTVGELVEFYQGWQFTSSIEKKPLEISDVTQSSAALLAARSRFHVQRWTQKLYTCTANSSHQWLPDELDDGMCPRDGAPVK